MIKQIITIFLLFYISEECFSQPTQFNVYLLNNLNFGDVYIGYPKDIPNTDVNAAKFSITLSAGKIRHVDLTFTLPGNLLNGSYKIPVTFDLNHSAWSNTDQVSGRTLFNPYNTLVFNKPKNGEVYYLWLGALLNAQSDIPPGAYVATIILTVDLY